MPLPAPTHAQEASAASIFIGEATLLTNGRLEASMAVLAKPFPLEALADRVRKMAE
ncbi:hypothetical protein [Massilia sp. METH4]|uniref:hypothetical protein n=1 Tax=Massilia sp. METH4 TaxID=3123041 RepID=UPI0030D24164